MKKLIVFYSPFIRNLDLYISEKVNNETEIKQIKNFEISINDLPKSIQSLKKLYDFSEILLRGPSSMLSHTQAEIYTYFDKNDIEVTILEDK